jgi:vacuolar-type H+-ATPase subunit H
MQIDQYTLYAVLLVFCALVLLLIAMIVVYIRLVNKLAKGKDEGQDKVGDANVQAKRIIASANDKAQQIIANAELFSSEEKKKFEEGINKSIHNYASQYNQVLSNSQNELEKVLSAIPNTIKENVGIQLDNFNKLLQTEVVNSREKLTAGVEAIFKTTESEIEKYKAQRLTLLDNSIIRVVEEVSKRVLAKQISLAEQEKLVMKALEEAKRRMALSDLEEEGSGTNG